MWLSAATSPRISALADALTDHTPDALATFWVEVETEGTPLIEPIPDDPESVIVTFLWRAIEPITTTVALDGEIFGVETNRNQLTRLADSDVWYRTYRMPAALRATYLVSPNDSMVPIADLDPMDHAALAQRMATFRPDPLNHQPFPTAQPWCSSFALPRAEPQRWLERVPARPRGELHQHALESVALQAKRTVFVYTPPGYGVTGARYPLVVLFDGAAYTDLIPTPTILDNLVAEGLIQPVVAVFIDHPMPAARTQDLTCSPAFLAFVRDECLPWAQQHYHSTDDPHWTLIGGSSFGGLAAAYIALHSGGCFGKVLSLSGGFGWTPQQEERDPRNEPGWLIRSYVTEPVKPLNFYLRVGQFETVVYDTYMPSTLAMNRHFRDVLRAKGYYVDYGEYCGGHDPLCWRGELGAGLCALLAGQG